MARDTESSFLPLKEGERDEFRAMSDLEEDAMGNIDDAVENAEDDNGDDLFGDEAPDEDLGSDRPQVLSDNELDSDSDEARYRRDDASSPKQVTDKVIMGVKVYRHRIPKPQDNTLRSIRVPEFLTFVPEPYDPDQFQPSYFDLANAREAQSKEAIRFMRDADSGKLRSNSSIFRWSDGLVTLSVGGEHYEIQRKALASGPDKSYQEVQDGHYYAASAELSSNLLMIVGHVSEQYTVRPTKAIGDDALSRLAERMAAATQAREADVTIKITGDPELARKKAELAEKERIKAQRRRENAQARMELGGSRYGRSGGLSVGDLEGGRRVVSGGTPSRKRGAAGTAPRRRRQLEYESDDEERELRQQEGYDLDDDLIAPSDEENEAGDDDEDDDDGILDDEEDEKGASAAAARRTKRQRTTEADEDADADAEGEVDDEGPVVVSQDLTSRGRRRTLIDDDEDE